MDRCLKFTYRWHDDHLVEFDVIAWNGSFGGTTRLYLGHGELANAADSLSGFPKNIEDSREVTFGAFGPETGAGAMELKFICIDRAGHCRLLLKLEADPILQKPPLQCVELLGAVEPASLDQFLEQMRSLDSSLVGSAVLHLT